MADLTQTSPRLADLPLESSHLQGLLLAHAPDLARYLESRFPTVLRGRVTVEDLIQEVWVAAFRNQASFRPDNSDSVVRWLFTIARNKLLDHLKHMRRGALGREIRLGAGACDRGSSSLLDVFDVLAAGQQSPSRDVASGEAAAAVKAALVTLSADRETALRLRYIEQHSVDEIAQEMGRTHSAVRSLLFHGLRELRKTLGRSGRFFSHSNTASAAWS